MPEIKKIVKIRVNPLSGEVEQLPLKKFDVSSPELRPAGVSVDTDVYVDPKGNEGYGLKSFVSEGEEIKPVGAFLQKVQETGTEVYASVEGKCEFKEVQAIEMPVKPLGVGGRKGIKAVGYAHRFFRSVIESSVTEEDVLPDSDRRLIDNLNRLERSKTNIDIWGAITGLDETDAIILWDEVGLGLHEYHRNSKSEFYLKKSDVGYTQEEKNKIQKSLEVYGIKEVDDIRYNGSRPPTWTIKSKTDTDESTELTLIKGLCSDSEYDGTLEIRDAEGTKITASTQYRLRRNQENAGFEVDRLSEDPDWNFIGLVNDAVTTVIGCAHQKNFRKPIVTDMHSTLLGTLTILFGNKMDRTHLTGEPIPERKNPIDERLKKSSNQGGTTVATKEGEDTHSDWKSPSISAWINHLDEVISENPKRKIFPFQVSRNIHLIEGVMQQGYSTGRFLLSGLFDNLIRNHSQVVEYFRDSWDKTSNAQRELGFDDDLVKAFMNKRNEIFCPKVDAYSDLPENIQADKLDQIDIPELKSLFRQSLIHLALSDESSEDSVEYCRERDLLQKVTHKLAKLAVTDESGIQPEYYDWERMCRDTKSIEGVIEIARAWMT